MEPVLILTDDPASGNQLARWIGGGAIACDLYGRDTDLAGARLIVADIRLPHSSTLLRLKRALARVRRPATPFLYLIHGNVVRGEALAIMLGATKTLPAPMAAAFLARTVDAMSGGASHAPRTPLEHVQAARQAFAELFTAEGPTNEIVDYGTEIVNRAIQDMKVGDWLTLVASFDDITHRHCLTVAGLAAAFSATLHFCPADAHFLTKGALLHDIGKAQIPLEILNKQGPLTADEREVMKRHPSIGYDMLKGRGFHDLALKVVRSHHELLDGTGYPDGLHGDDIPDPVRLITICDIFAALIEHRPYKAPMSAGRAYDILSGMTGKLDADLVRAFAPVAQAGGIEPIPLSA